VIKVEDIIVGTKPNNGLKKIGYTLNKYKFIIVCITLFFTIVGTLISIFLLNTTYQCETSVVIGKTHGDIGNVYNGDDVTMYQNLIKTYSEIAKSRVVAQKASEYIDNRKSYDKLQKATLVKIQDETQILILKVKDDSSTYALEDTKAVSRAFIEEATKVFPDGAINVIDEPIEPSKPVGPNHIFNIIIFFITGAIFSIVVVFIKSFFGDFITDEEDIKMYLDVPIIGIIPKYKIGNS
jgi:capsular polysaccharide biosynthesis protein